MPVPDLAQNRQVSPGQVLVLTYGSTVAFGLIAGPGAMIERWGSAVPLGYALGMLAAIAHFSLMLVLARRHPRQTVVQYGRRLLGWAAYPVLFAAMAWAGTYAAVTEYLFIGISRAVLLPRTPIQVPTLLLSIVTFVGVMMGLEAILRLFYLITWLELLALLPALLFSGINITFSFLQPAWPQDPTALTAGLVEAYTSYIGFGIILYAYPYVAHRGTTWRWGAGGLALSGLVLTLIATGAVGVYSAANARDLLFPAYDYLGAARVPGTFAFLQRYSLIFLVIWVLASVKAKIAFVWAVCTGLQQLLGLRKNLSVVLVVAGLIYAGSISIPDLETARRLALAMRRAGFVMDWGLVAVLLVASLLRRGRGAVP